MGSTPIKHYKDGSWRGHEHKSLLGKLTGKIADDVSGGPVELSKEEKIKKAHDDLFRKNYPNWPEIPEDLDVDSKYITDKLSSE